MFASPTTAGSTAVWGQIGDAFCALLPDGNSADGIEDRQQRGETRSSCAHLDIGSIAPRVGSSDEDSWALMQDNTVVAPSCKKPPTTSGRRLMPLRSRRIEAVIERQEHMLATCGGRRSWHWASSLAVAFDRCVAARTECVLV